MSRGLTQLLQSLKTAIPGNQETELSSTNSPQLKGRESLSNRLTRQPSDSSVRRYSGDQIEPFPPFPVPASSLPTTSPGTAKASPRPGSLNADSGTENDHEVDGEAPPLNSAVL